MKLTIEQGTELCRLLADPSRLRLLLLLERHPLSVAELTDITNMAQSRVSTHLARLTRAGFVQSRRSGGASRYTALAQDGNTTELWQLMRNHLSDAQADVDRERADAVVRNRDARQTWAESVAGRMESQYSPGRTWEATARALIGLLDLGDVLDSASGDGVIAELLSPRSRTVTCMDISAKVLSAARNRLKTYDNVTLCRGDMHAPPFRDASFDHVFLMHALSFTRDANVVLAKSARLLRPGGRLVVVTLKSHRHAATMEAYDHVNLGTTPDTLRKQLQRAGLGVESCRSTSRELRPPYFQVITAFARKHA